MQKPSCWPVIVVALINVLLVRRWACAGFGDVARNILLFIQFGVAGVLCAGR